MQRLRRVAQVLQNVAELAEDYPQRRLKCRNSGIVQATLAQFPWYPHIALLEKVKRRTERLWYAQSATPNGRSRNILMHQFRQINGFPSACPGS